MSLSLCRQMTKLSLINPQLKLACTRHRHPLTPRLRTPEWFIRRDRYLNDENLTHENRTFIKEIVNEELEARLAESANILKEASQTMPVVHVKHINRTGLIAKKIGVYPMWTKDGRQSLTTLLQIIENQVVKFIPPEEWHPKMYKKRYSDLPKYKKGCLVVGSETIDPTTITKEYYNLFKNTGVLPKKHLCRFIISSKAALPPGTPLFANHFRVGDYIDIRGNTIYHGFQGVMKRWGFKGMPATHGVTKTHRRPGNIGGGGEKARVWPGTKLPGHMGHKWRVFRGAQILRINPKYNVIWVKGKAIPGPTNGLCYLYDTILPLRKPKTRPPFPTYFPTDEEKDEEIYDENWHNFASPTIMFSES